MLYLKRAYIVCLLQFMSSSSSFWSLFFILRHIMKQASRECGKTVSLQLDNVDIMHIPLCTLDSNYNRIFHRHAYFAEFRNQNPGSIVYIVIGCRREIDMIFYIFSISSVVGCISMTMAIPILVFL